MFFYFCNKIKTIEEEEMNKFISISHVHLLIIWLFLRSRITDESRILFHQVCPLKNCLCAYLIAICEYLNYIFYRPEVKNIKQLLIYFCPCWVIIAALVLFSSCVVTGGYSLALVHGLLIEMVSLVMEHRLQGEWASVVLAYGLSCSMPCGIFLNQESNRCPLH